ncbi:MAG: tyrosine-type recombinase/integrase, partial [Nitrospiraceae bacterium]|nr:tyrosine-type recombinase/integrase [Nitrospiraceae bacterium]
MAAVYKRGQVWWVRFRFNGIHVRRSAKTTKKAEAQAYLLRLMEEYGQAARGGATQRYKISDAIVRFFEETSLKPGTIAGYKSHARIVCRLFGEAHLDEVHRQRLADFIAQRKRTGVADASIRRDLAFLSSVFNQAIRWGWLEMSPFKDFSFRSLKLGRPRTRFLTREEYNQLYLASSATLKPILLLAVETGLRKDELLGLKVSNIDLRRRELQLEETKT